MSKNPPLHELVAVLNKLIQALSVFEKGFIGAKLNIEPGGTRIIKENPKNGSDSKRRIIKGGSENTDNSILIPGDIGRALDFVYFLLVESLADRFFPEIKSDGDIAPLTLRDRLASDSSFKKGDQRRDMILRALDSLDDLLKAKSDISSDFHTTQDAPPPQISPSAQNAPIRQPQFEVPKMPKMRYLPRDVRTPPPMRRSNSEPPPSIPIEAPSPKPQPVQATPAVRVLAPVAGPCPPDPLGRR